jgi:hypothetical protein
MTIDLRLGRWQEALADVDAVDCLCFDAPYSERTHEGHDASVVANRFPKGQDRSRIGPDGGWRSEKNNTRRSIAYQPLSDADAVALVEHWAPRTRGWICCLTDHLLAPVYAEALEAAGRYVFSPLACVDPGSRVRLAGDGPSQWTCWLVVSRPRAREWASWGTTRGAYLRGQRKAEKLLITGGKPLWLMQDIISDYTRPGDLVVDPFAGSGTTAVACHRLGRNCVTSEMDPATHAMARARIERELAQGDLFAGVEERVNG